ncbi:cell division protein FtsZ [Marivirga sp. S37H4]|uniref:Cell division protein FtsZ n=1 Tax=Marivirga aurantiaca TaxID=2802615 RepID=A0A934X104_9BACT|nr:cell division protein FtsZ [Marivirga aurantiaca]MBK6266958.1 cell division protein FtsZ [Marivirga aurantiaca]
MTEGAYKFEIPKHHKSIIKVIGVGGGGSNAVNHMFNQGIKDVEFIICNTDAQALKTSPVPNKLQIGLNLTSGLGAGANPAKGKEAAMESKEDIRELLGTDTKMLFVTAGMGGGTGTGAAPVIARIAREMDILTVGIVTSPFGFEGKKKAKQAEEGIRELKENCDTVLVILNDKLREIYGNLTIGNAFAKADNVLTTGAKGIAEIITVPGYVNVDFEDVKTVMKNAGAAVMGSARTEGDGRAIRAAEEALSSPLLNNTDILGAQKILLSIISGEQAELQMDELTEITDYIQEQAGEDAEVIFGHGVDESLGHALSVTVIATGFDNSNYKRDAIPERESKRVFDLDAPKQFTLFNNEEEDVRKQRNENRSRPEERREPAPEKKQRPEEGRGYSFGFPSQEPLKEEDEDRFEYDYQDEESEEDTFTQNLSDEYEIVNKRPDPEAQQRAEEERQEFLRQRSKERIAKLKQLNGGQTNTPESYKQMEVPAYKRKQVKLREVPHSSEKNISKFNLNDDNQILGNNKFLHDNVD